MIKRNVQELLAGDEEAKKPHQVEVEKAISQSEQEELFENIPKVESDINTRFKENKLAIGSKVESLDQKGDNNEVVESIKDSIEIPINPNLISYKDSSFVTAEQQQQPGHQEFNNAYQQEDYYNYDQ